MNTEEELEKIFKTINTKQIKSILENQTQTLSKFFQCVYPEFKHYHYLFNNTKL